MPKPRATCGPYPGQSVRISRAPASSARAGVVSLLFESSTSTSSANDALATQSLMFRASFFATMTIVNVSGCGMASSWVGGWAEWLLYDQIVPD